jgi:hypothetical protein
MSHLWRRVDFQNTWQDLHNYGYCDAARGAEYRRVAAEWEAAGRPDPWVFIISVINRKAPRPPRKERHR